MTELKILSLIDGDDIDTKKISKIKHTKIFAFDILSHKFLQKKNLEHFIADDQLNIKERKKIFDHIVSKLYWYKNNSLNHNLSINGYNILEMLDPLYLHQKLLVALIQFNIIKKIIENEKPSKIFATQNMSKIISSLDHDIDIVLLNSEKSTTFDTFDFRMTIFSKILSVKISMKNLKWMQNIFESFLGKLCSFWLDPNDQKPIILLLEFDPSQFPDLFLNLKSSKYNLVILNRRKSTLSNSKSIQIMKNSNAKLVNFKNLLSKKEKIEIINLEKKSQKNLQDFWKDENSLKEIFTFENLSYWPCIRDFLIKQYEKEISNNIENLIQSKYIFQKLDIKCILYQYESGNFENTTLSQRQKIPALLLRHGFSSYTKKFDELRWRHDQFRLVKLKCDEILLWGTYDYEFYLKFLLDSKKLKIIGSPRHDIFFKTYKNNSENDKIILITVPPMIEWTGLQDTHLAIRYENTLKKLIEKIKKMDNVKIIVKLHPGWGWKFNSVLIKIFHEIDPKISIYSTKSIKHLISESDLMININAEDNQPSTVILEGLIMKKPVINISLNEQNDDFEYNENSPFVEISYKSDVINYINLVLNDINFKQKLDLQIPVFLKKYLSNHKTASKELSDYLKSFL